MIEDGMSKGLIYDFIRTHYRGTMFSSKVIKQEEYDEFQKYILIDVKKNKLKIIKNL